ELQIQENKYKNQVKDIINASMKEIEDKNKEIDKLTNQLQDANTQNTALQEAHNLAVELQKEHQKKLQTAEQAQESKLNELLAQAKNDKERLEAYESEVLRLTLANQHKDEEHFRQLKDKERILKLSSAKTHEISEKNAKIHGLSREKAALEIKEIGYKGEIELLEKQKKDLQEFQLKLSNEKTQEEKKNETLRQTVRDKDQEISNLAKAKQESNDKFLKEQREHNSTKTDITQKQAQITELENRLKNYEGGPIYKALSWVGEKTGFTALKNSVGHIAQVCGLIMLLFAFSYLWKWLIKPTIKNFKSEPTNKPNPPTKETLQPQPVEVMDIKPISQISVNEKTSPIS
ncbi:16001_t:CDS:2, partial [Racocetra fulgida]